MKRITTLFFVLMLMAGLANGQSKKSKFYSTSGGEIIFSGVQLDNNGDESGGIIRFAPVFNFTHQLNYEPVNGFGFFAGLGAKNLGFIYDLPNSNERKKYRTYAASVPLGITLGKRNDTFFFLGYQFDAPVHFKEKTFVGDNRVARTTAWFTKRNPQIMRSVFIGFSPVDGAEFKFNYYLSNFFEQGFTTSTGQTPYDFEANLITFSVSWTLFRSGRWIH